LAYKSILSTHETLESQNTQINKIILILLA